MSVVKTEYQTCLAHFKNTLFFKLSGKIFKFVIDKMGELDKISLMP